MGSVVILGVGLTVIVNSTGSPSQIPIVGITVYVTVPTVLLLFTRVCTGIVVEFPFDVKPETFALALADQE